MLGTVISLFTVLPMALASGAVLPTGPVVVAVGAIVWPVTLVTARMATHRKPIEAIAVP